MLEEGSGLTPGVIEQRGYWSATTVQDLKDLGFHSVERSMLPSLVIPMHGVDGDVVYHQHRPDNPRISNGRPVKYESLPGQPPRIDVPPSVQGLLNDPAIPLWITEGSKKADSGATRGFCIVSLLGVWNFKGAGERGSSLELADWDRIAIKGRLVYICYDSDVIVKPEVKRALQRLARILKRRGAKEVRPVLIPHIPGGKTGIDDWFVRGGSSAELMQSVDTNLLRFDGIVCNGRGLADVSADALGVLVESNIPPTLFVRAGELVRVRTDERQITKVEALNAITLRGVLARASSWVNARKDGPIEISPPKDVVEDVLALPEWPELPPIVAITSAPVVGPSGQLCVAPGYDPGSRFFIASREAWPTWEGSIKSALDLILGDFLGDFPFTSEADRAHALALMLLPILRPYIDGPTPLHLIDAPVQGSGKSLLARMCLIPTVGDKISATTGTKDEEEWRKKIASSLLEGRSYIFLDNLSRKVDSDTLAGVLTSTEWNDRALSTMRNINVPVRTVWVATANNAELSRDIVRRTVWTRLDAELERPEDRTGFRHENLERWAIDNRVRIVSALCRLIQAWIDAGRPEWTGRHLGSFEEWSKAIGGVLMVAGVNGFLGNRDELRVSANSDEESWTAFYLRWFELKGSTGTQAGHLIECFREDETLAAMLGDKGESSQKTRLGFFLKRRLGVVAGGFKIVRDSDFRGSTVYRMIQVSKNREGVCAEKTNPLTTPSHISTPTLGSNQLDFEGVEGVEGVFSYPAYGKSSDTNENPGNLPPTATTPSNEPKTAFNPLTQPPQNGAFDHQNDDQEEII
jgi:hypothetical protein